jgi:hypothetical protein
MPKPSELHEAESRIVDVKSDLSRISRHRIVAFRDGRADEGAFQQLRLLEAELRNIQALASYVKAVSPAAGRELAGHHAEASARFERLRAGGDLSALQDWLKKDLVPLVNKSEQAAHLVATALRRTKGKEAKPFAWRVRTED